ncbi:MAG: FkbM family methyltransferase [Pseudomonadota bacterium]|nr:FkbM family methyltransferase [Pseudomonadota bacterium]RCK27372.1 hypothetical protein TH8_05575 [Thalassospira profundimaris]
MKTKDRFRKNEPIRQAHKVIKELKAKYIKPTRLYKLYRILKAKTYTAYAGWGEDILLERIYRQHPRRSSGIFVDVGCNNPVIGSTTWKLYKWGWRGLNLDLTKENIDLCKILRPRDVSVQCAITSHEGSVNSYIFDPGSGLNTLDKEFADEWAKKINKPYHVVPIDCRTLDQAIEDHLGVEKIDLLTVDVENHEFEVLSTFSFQKYSPDFILCEVHGKSIEDVLKTRTCKLIKSNGYLFISYTGGTALFVKDGIDYTI